MYCLLVAFGIAYNYLVQWIERKGIDGYEWAEVSGGVGLTLLLCLPLVGWQVVAWVLLAFVCSGAPMIIGALWRRELRVKRALERAKSHAEQAATDRE